MNLEIRENYTNKCFHYYKKISLFSHILQLKVGMPVMILCNLELSIKCNETRAWITYISQHNIKAEIISGSKADTQIVILYILL